LIAIGVSAGLATLHTILPEKFINVARLIMKKPIRQEAMHLYTQQILDFSKVLYIKP